MRPSRLPGLLRFLRGLARLISARPHVPRPLQGNVALRTILERRSQRRFQERDLDPDAWRAILEAGRVAPSTVNLQTWSFAWFTRASWQETFGRRLPFGAPRAVIILADTHRARRVVTGFPEVPLCDHTVGVMNASLAAMNMAQAAEALGIGAVMLSETGKTGFYDAAELAAALQLPPRVIPLMTVVFGHPDAAPPPMPPRLPLDAVAFPGRYRETPRPVLEGWFEQMQAGYRASAGQAFDRQVDHYNRRLADAETDLRRLVLGD